MTDRVFVSNLCIHGYHGVIDAEKSLGQKFFVDIDCEIERPDPDLDKMSETVCYGALCDLAENISGEGTFNLIEVLADRIAHAVLETYPIVRSVRIQIRKPSAPIRHVVDHVGVETVKRRRG